MNTNNKNNTWGGQTYETPTVKELDIQSEGVLCGSFDSDNNTEIFDREDMEDL